MSRRHACNGNVLLYNGKWNCNKRVRCEMIFWSYFETYGMHHGRDNAFPPQWQRFFLVAYESQTFTIYRRVDIVILGNTLGHTLIDIVIADSTRRDLVNRFARNDLIAATDVERRKKVHYRDRKSGTMFVLSILKMCIASILKLCAVFDRVCIFRYMVRMARLWWFYIGTFHPSNSLESCSTIPLFPIAHVV